MIDKKIYRYSNVELLDVIKNGIDKTEVGKAEYELQSRNLTHAEKVKIESDYLKFKKFQQKRKTEPLTTEEWLTFFILPFFTPKPIGRNDHFSESELERFEKYGFKEKIKQARKAKFLGVIFWMITLTFIALIIR